jgi:hypothetical protein
VFFLDFSLYRTSQNLSDTDAPERTILELSSAAEPAAYRPLAEKESADNPNRSISKKPRRP